jgi:hypothetical protein
MKKFLLSFLLAAAVSFAFAQLPNLPCVADYKINNGGGHCADLNGTPATGTVTLTFDGAVDPANLPIVVSVALSTDPGNPITGDAFQRTGVLNNNGTVTYCYYVGPANGNNLNGKNQQYIFTVAYDINGHLTPCGSQSPLPVSFALFTAARSNNVVSVKWTTASESNNLGFEVQRLIGTGNWQTVSFVATKALNGNSPTGQDYSFTDQNPTRGVSQYRIKQVDIDQRARFSDIRAVRGLGQMAKTIVFPNPSLSGGKVNVIFDEKDGARDVSLIDMSGRVIRQWKGFTNNNLQIENLTSGFYNLRIVLRETGEQDVEKIVVNKN